MATTIEEVYQFEPAPPANYKTADNHEDIIKDLERRGLGNAAKRLRYLRRITEEDPDEPRIELDSLRQLAQFLDDERGLPAPRIAVSFEGLMQIEWRTDYRGILAMKFFTDGMVQFAGMRTDLKRVSGTCRKDEMMRELQSFIAKSGLA